MLIRGLLGVLVHIWVYVAGLCMQTVMQVASQSRPRVEFLSCLIRVLSSFLVGLTKVDKQAEFTSYFCTTERVNVPTMSFCYLASNHSNIHNCAKSSPLISQLDFHEHMEIKESTASDQSNCWQQSETVDQNNNINQTQRQ